MTSSATPSFHVNGNETQEALREQLCRNSEILIAKDLKLRRALVRSIIGYLVFSVGYTAWYLIEGFSLALQVLIVGSMLAIIFYTAYLLRGCDKRIAENRGYLKKHGKV